MGNLKGINFGGCIHDSKYIHQTIMNHCREMFHPGILTEWDSNLNSPDSWGASDLKVLCVFLSSGDSRSSAFTDSVIHTIVKSAFGDSVFIDFAYLPLKASFPWFE